MYAELGTHACARFKGMLENRDVGRERSILSFKSIMRSLCMRNIPSLQWHA